MGLAERLFTRLRQLQIWQQSLIVTGSAVICADSLTLAFYSIFFADRLVLDLVLSAIITVIVAFPISLVFLTQAAKVERLAEELRQASQTDHLTRLANRREFMTSVGKSLTGTPHPRGAGTLLYIDADRFKHINDTHGHAAGDNVLVKLAEIIGSSVRKGDIAARIGGEEFAVFLHGANVNAAFTVAERIRSHSHGIGRALGLPGDQVSVSIGIALHRSGQDLEDVLRAADRSLYVAKNNGRDMVVCDEALPVAA